MCVCCTSNREKKEKKKEPKAAQLCLLKRFNAGKGVRNDKRANQKREGKKTPYYLERDYMNHATPTAPPISAAASTPHWRLSTLAAPDCKLGVPRELVGVASVLAAPSVASPPTMV